MRNDERSRPAEVPGWSGGRRRGADLRRDARVAGGHKPGKGHGHGHDGDHHGGSSIPRDNISIQLYTLRDQLTADAAGTLKALGRIGYKTVEHAGFAGKTAAEFKAVAAGGRPARDVRPSGHPAAVRRRRVADAAQRRAHDRAALHRPPGRRRSRTSRRTATPPDRGPDRRRRRGRRSARRSQQGGRDGAPGRPALRRAQPLLGVRRRSRTTRR